MMQMVVSGATTEPTSTWSWATTPARWARTGCSIFIASIVATGLSAATSWPSSTATLTTTPFTAAVSASELAAGPGRPGLPVRGGGTGTPVADRGRARAGSGGAG